MKPVFFPFTFIDESSARVMLDLFGGISVIGVSKKTGISQGYASPEGVEVHIPGILDDKKLEAVFQGMVAWGGMHGRRELATRKLVQDQVPFRSDSAVDSIRSMIRAGAGAGPEKKDVEKDPLFDALLFLRVAHGYDEHCSGIDEGLASCDAIGKRLFSQLKGEGIIEEDILKDSDILLGSRCEHKPAERLASWATVFSSMVREFTYGSRLFITDSPAVFELIRERVPGAEGPEEFVCDSHASRAAMAVYLSDRLQGEEGEAWEKSGAVDAMPDCSMKFLWVKGFGVTMFSSRFISTESCKLPEITGDHSDGVVIGLLCESK